MMIIAIAPPFTLLADGEGKNTKARFAVSC
jgi:hypothetical protein